MQRAVDVKPMNNYLLLIKFDNGEEKIYNCFPLLQDKLFSKISDKEFFKTVHIDDMGLVCWDDSTDINPYDLYECSESISNFDFAG
jgi:hypothetical protein